MKTFGLIALVVLLVIVLAGALAYAVGAKLPVNHSASVTGTVPAPPDKVFARIADYAHGADWRPIKSVTVLPSDNERDRWIEDIGHGQTMTFVALRSEVPSLREVRLDDPKAAYGGTWTYQLSPGPTPNQTILKITEDGFIHPPLYRFMMAHIMGPTRNLDQYMAAIQAAAAKP